MKDSALPAVSLAAVPGRRRATLELAREIERRGFAGIYCPSFGDGLALCEALALVTERIRFGTSIANIYTRHVSDLAQTASFIHELSGGRFLFGVGVSHRPLLGRMGLEPGRPLEDMRRFVTELGRVRRPGELPPLVLAALRRKMVALAGELGRGVVFANASRSHMASSLAALPESARSDPEFFVGNMIPICVSEDARAAAAVHRRTLAGYVQLPNYRRYWKEAGYVDEMEAVERALRAGEQVTDVLSARWLADATLSGPAAAIREGVEAWREAGVSTPILVPSSVDGGQMKAFEELFTVYGDAA